jgi:putative transposase
MVRPSQKRVVVRYLGAAYSISERRACQTVRCARASYRYRSYRNPRTALRQRIREMAQARVRYGYRKIRVLLNREGWAVGKHLVYRLYREEGLTLRQRPPRRRKAVVVRAHRPPVTRPNDAWTLDFVADQLVNGQRFRALTVVDVCTRESLAIEVGQRLRGEHVVTVLNRLIAQRGTPTRLFCDNGSEFCSQIVDLWAYQHQVRIDFSRPGTPTDNAHVESFNATLRRECLNAHWFESLREAQERIEAWRREYNESRPHRALQDRTPEEFAKRVAENYLSEPRITAGNSP